MKTIYSHMNSLIEDYLNSGGYFNPELMDHDKVRDLILDLRCFISAAEMENDVLIYKNNKLNEKIKKRKKK